MRRRTLVQAAAALVVVILGVGVGVAALRAREPDGPSSSEVATDRPCPELRSAPALPRLAAGQVTLRSAAEADEPTAAVFAPDGSGDGFLAERRGTVLRIERGTVTEDVVIDLTEDTLGKGDGGLLALAYDPGASWLYVYRADADHDNVLLAYPLDEDGEVDADEARQIISIDHPSSVQHHGGSLAFDADGLLYLGLGDGGGLGDPRGNAQDPGIRLGKVLRLQPTPDRQRPYEIPTDNPFVDRADWAPEIWVLGVRNPFRMSFDPVRGELWLGDVGQSCWEELDRLPTGAGGAGGANLGWDHLEGTRAFEGGEVPGRALAPAREEAHRAGWCGIVAGYVVRDADRPELDGRLLYTDYCKGHVLALAVDETATGPAVVDTGLRVDSPTAIVPGPRDEPWILTLEGDVLAVS